MGFIGVCKEEIEQLVSCQTEVLPGMLIAPNTAGQGAQT